MFLCLSPRQKSYLTVINNDPHLISPAVHDIFVHDVYRLMEGSFPQFNIHHPPCIVCSPGGSLSQWTVRNNLIHWNIRELVLSLQKWNTISSLGYFYWLCNFNRLSVWPFDCLFVCLCALCCLNYLEVWSKEWSLQVWSIILCDCQNQVKISILNRDM